MSENVAIRLGAFRINPNVLTNNQASNLYTPGQTITCQTGFMRLVEGVHNLFEK